MFGALAVLVVGILAVSSPISAKDEESQGLVYFYGCGHPVPTIPSRAG